MPHTGSATGYDLSSRWSSDSRSHLFHEALMRRFRPRFGLRTLLVAVTLVSGGFALVAIEVEQRARTTCCRPIDRIRSKC